MALTAATLPFILKLANGGGSGAWKGSAELRSALTCHAGTMTNKPTADALGIPYTEV
jgi:alanine dehydrogenase